MNKTETKNSWSKWIKMANVAEMDWSDGEQVKLESPSPKDALWQVWSKLAQ